VKIINWKMADRVATGILICLFIIAFLIGCYAMAVEFLHALDGGDTRANRNG
jgi:hypothetical protein